MPLPIAFFLVSSILSAAAGKTAPYLFDEADQTVPAVMLEGDYLYDPGLATRNGELWLTWLEFVPEKGDSIWVGRRQGNEWSLKEQVSAAPGKYSRPTLTVDAAGRMWLTYEAQDPDGQQWDVFARQRLDNGAYGEPQRVSPGAANDINHSVAADPCGGLWVAWQTDNGGQFDVAVRRIGSPADAAAADEARIVSESPLGDWEPSVTATPGGEVCVSWDAYDGESFNVLSRWRVGQEWQQMVPVAASPAFEGRCQTVCDHQGRVWAIWEEGGLNWGKPFRGRISRWDNVTDVYGPMHRLRKLRIAVLDRNGPARLLANTLPMPSFAMAAQRPNKRAGANELGVFYERGLLAVDRDDRLWVAYRHYYEPQAGLDEPTLHHGEEGWRLYARCLTGGAWSKLFEFDIPQRDALQRLSVAPHGDGLAAAWATGRTDRRTTVAPRGVAMATVSNEGAASSLPKLQPTAPPAKLKSNTEPPARPKPAMVGGKAYQMFFGDLHRHTDLSLCFPFYDGSLDDAYRYAIDVARLDFLGVTDHGRDIAKGDALSHLWWRCAKEVGRHRLQGIFFPYFAYEHSHNETDHNVISLRDDALRPDPPPLPDLWGELDHDSFTIPHNPIRIKTWGQQDDAMRPLLEIYQGYRDQDMQTAAAQGLDKGYRLGFIASSDHLSTAASFGGVWAPEADRESIFRSMQARRTFGATDKIRLIFRAGDHWMGERFSAAKAPEFQIEVDGTAPIESLQVVLDGKPAQTIPTPGAATSIKTTYSPDPNLAGEHYVYIHMKQVDGNQAWSSPIWVNVGEAQN